LRQRRCPKQSPKDKSFLVLFFKKEPLLSKIQWKRTMTRNTENKTKLRLGMVGGGHGAFIGAVHRMAARLDDEFELIAAALSADPARALSSGQTLGLAPDRIYESYTQMLEREAVRPDRIDAVAIVTPNHLHFPVAQLALELGFHVICDKPMTVTRAEAETLVALQAKTGLVFCLTHNYTGYPMVRQARAMVEAGALGPLRVVQVEYPQEWLTEEVVSKQAEWRNDPSRAGSGGCIGDIGTHAFQLACYVTQLKPQALLAELTTFVPDRRLDDNACMLLRFEGGARGMLWASQVAPGHDNALRLRIYGEKAGLEWAQETPNSLIFSPYGAPKQILTRNGPGNTPAALRVTRVPAGHPEGYVEAFATLYTEAARAIRAYQAGQSPEPEVHYPTATDGLQGIRFIQAAITSSAANGNWTEI
jgi:predicted dehydrogenase